MPKPLVERDIAKACRKRWDDLGLLYRRVAWIGRNGAPDFVVMDSRLADWVRGRPLLGSSTIWVETKRPGGAPEPIQEREHARMRAAGQVVLVIATVEDLDRWFPL